MYFNSLKAKIPPVYPFELPMLHHFAEFLFSDALFTPQEIDRINSYWDASQSGQAELEGGETVKEDLRKSAVIGLEATAEYQWMYDKLANICLQCNNERYFFHLTGFYEQLQLAEYGVDDFFDWHLDFGVGLASPRKMSISVQLSDENDYEGGDLEFMINQKQVKAPRKRGTVIIFPSFILHRVTPITKGKRRSLVGWISGPPFR